MPRTAEIIAVGSELLDGGVTNTNAAFLSRLLTAAGVEVLYHTTVDDDAARLEKAVTIARGRAELLVFTGGLGPTYDDMTKTAVCAALDQWAPLPPAGSPPGCCPACPLSAAIWPSTACCPGWSRSGDRRCGHTRCISSA